MLAPLTTRGVADQGRPSVAQRLVRAAVRTGSGPWLAALLVGAVGALPTEGALRVRAVLLVVSALAVLLAGGRLRWAGLLLVIGVDLAQWGYGVGPSAPQIATAVTVFLVVARSRGPATAGAAAVVLTAGLIFAQQLATSSVAVLPSLPQAWFPDKMAHYRASVLVVQGMSIVYLGTAWLAGFAWRRIRHTAALRDLAEQRATEARSDARVEHMRTEMARDVHDVVGHSLTVILAQADSLTYLDGEARDRAISAIADTARGSLREVRAVLQRIDERAPETAKALIGRVRSTGTPVLVDGDLDATLRDPEAGVVLGRVLHEMLTNALRHGTAGGQIVVRDRSDATTARIEVENGAALPPAPAGMGVVGMQQRLVRLGGHLETSSACGRFVVRATVPLEARGGIRA